MYLLRKWITIISFALCICLCFAAIAEEEAIEEPAYNDSVIDFTFNTTSVPDEYYAKLETDFPISELRLLNFKYYNWNRDECDGQIIVNRNIEFDALDALEDIYEATIRITDIVLFAGDGFDVIFWSPLDGDELDLDRCNIVFSRYGFARNDNQADGLRHYTMEDKATNWYPHIIMGPL